MNEKKLDILFMCDNGLESVVGGAEESTKIIMDGIKDKFSIGVIQPGSISRPISGVEYFKLTAHTRIKHLIKHPIAFTRYIFQTRNIIKVSNPITIHTQAQVSFFIVAFLKKLRLISKNIYIIHTERGLYVKYNNFIKQIFCFFLKELNMLITTTEFNMKHWKDAIQSRDLSLNFKIIENTAGQLFESYNEEFHKGDSDNLIIGFAGRYCDVKNWPLAVEICKKLNDVLGEKLYVKMAVGCLDAKAQKETEDMFDSLNAIMESRFDGVINIDIQAMDKFYYDLDVFILTSKYNAESFGRTLVEAMSRKTIVLTTNAGGPVEVVGNNENICETANEFVERILYFYNDKNIMKTEKEDNLLRVKQMYSLKNNIDKHLDMYTSIIDREKR